MKKLAKSFYILLAGMVLLTAGIWFTSYPKTIGPDNAGHELQTEVAEDTGVKEVDNTRKIPGYVIEVLQYIREYNKPPEGFVGGRTFYNREKRLPQQTPDQSKIYYREWDVHPKIQGKSRGPERLVTGSDGNAYFTPDHYSSFILLQ